MINPNHLNTISMILDEVKVTHFNTISSLNQHLLTSSDSNPNQIYKLITINVQNYFQLISSYKIPMQKEKTLTQILV